MSRGKRDWRLSTHGAGLDAVTVGTWLEVRRLVHTAPPRTWYVRVGDREATVVVPRSGGYEVRWKDAAVPGSVVVAAVPVDQEPPPRSVVLDKDGDAWQRGQLFWYMAGSSRGRTWRQLTDHGPLRLVHRGGDR